MSVSDHPFYGTPQYWQQYGWPADGRPGNGLGDVGGYDPLLWEAAGDYAYTMRPNGSRSQDDSLVGDDWVSPVSVGDLVLALEKITDKQSFVLNRRYGLFGHSKHTQEELAFAMGISHQAVQRIERRALTTLRGLLSRPLVGEDSVFCDDGP